MTGLVMRLRLLLLVVVWLTLTGYFVVAADIRDPKTKSRGPRLPFVPSPQDVVEKMLELAAVKKTDVVVDLGCGDGRIVVTAAKMYGCTAIGYDLDKECLRLARERAKEAGVQQLVRIEYEDLFHVDLSKVDVVCLYLLPAWNLKLARSSRR